MSPEEYNTEGWVIIGRTYPRCLWCERAKSLLDDCGFKYEFIDLGGSEDLFRFMVNQGLNTVPQIYHRGLRVGGYEDLGGYISRIEVVS